MNDTTKQQNTTPQAAQVQQQPVAPVSGPHKEVAPLAGQTSEYIRPVEAQPEIAQEVADAGVEQAVERPVIHPEVAQAGVTHAKETIPHHVDPAGVVVLPNVTQQQAVVMQKKNSVRDAARWLAVFVLRQFDKIAYQKLPTK